MTEAAGRRLYRSRADKKIAGVCGGIADYFGIDPAIVRIAAVVLFFLNGIGLIAYLIAWAAIPFGPGAGQEPAPPRAAAARDLDTVVGAFLIGAGLLFLLLNLGLLDWAIFRFWRWRVLWPLVVIALGVYIVMSSLRVQRRAKEP